MALADEADKLHRALTAHLPKLDGPQHGLVHRLHLLTSDFVRGMRLAVDQATELRARLGE